MSFQGFCIYLQARDETKDLEHFHTIQRSDEILDTLVGQNRIDRFLMCPTCMLKGKDRFFSQVGPGFEPLNPNEHCHSLVNENYVDDGGLHDEGSDDEESDDETDEEKHALDQKFKVLRKVEEQHNLLHEFLEEGIQTIPKKPFRELEKELQVGHQIWIYRDGSTNCNPVAVLMPYAHVAVYVGIEGGKKKVVHVAKASTLKGVMTATIEKVSLTRVIKPDDEGNLFLNSGTDYFLI